MLRPTTATIAHNAKSLSNMIYIRFLYSSGSVWLDPSSETQMTPTQFSSPIQYLLLVNTLPYHTLQFFCPVFVSDLHTPPQQHPASTQGFEKGCSQEGCWLLPTEGVWGSTCLMQPNQHILPQPSYLCLKIQIHQRAKGKGWGLLRCNFWAKICPKQGVSPPSHILDWARPSKSQVQRGCCRDESP